MLKLTYADSELQLERLADSLETLVAQRAVLAVRLGQNLRVETSSASFLLPRDIPGLAALEIEICREQAQHCPDGLAAGVDLYPVDETSYEVCLRGVWLAADVDAHEGMFLAVVSDRIERLLHKLWAMTQSQVFLSG